MPQRRPPGSDTQCIFNDAGSFGADTGCVYNKTTNTLTLTGGISIPCDTATAECIMTIPNETVDISEAGEAGTCNEGIVSGVPQLFCNAGTRQAYVMAEESTGNVTVTGELRGKRTPTFGTADTYTMLQSDCGTTIGNTDADGLEIDLIADPTGCVVCVFGETSQAIILDPNSTDIFIVNGLTPAAGDSITLAAGVGNNLCLQGKDATTWWVFLGTGTVTDTN